MGYVPSESGKVVYVKYRRFLLPISKKTRTHIVRPDSGDLEFPGSALKRVEIPNDPVPISFTDEAFKTSDGAKVSVTLEINVSPKIDSDDEEIEKCVPAYEGNADDTKPKTVEWLKKRMTGLMNLLAEYPFEAIENSRLDPAQVRQAIVSMTETNHSWLFRVRDLKLNGLIDKLRKGEDLVSKHLHAQLTASTKQLMAEYDGSSDMAALLQEELIYELNQILKAPSVYDQERFAPVKLTKEIQEMAAQDPRGEELIRLNRLLLEAAYPGEIEESQKNEPLKVDSEAANEKSLLKTIEGYAGRILKDHNFKVEPKTCKISCTYPPRAHLNEDEPTHQPILAYMNMFKPRTQKLHEQEDKYKRALKQLKNDYDVQIKEIEKEFREREQKVDDDLAQLTKQKTISEAMRQKDIEITLLEEEAQAAGREAQAKIDKLNAKRELKAEEIAEKVLSEIGDIQRHLALTEERKKLLQQTDGIPLSLERVFELKGLQHQFQVEAQKQLISYLGTTVLREQKKWEVDLDRETEEIEHKRKLDLLTSELQFSLLQRVFERSTLLAYSRLKTDDQQEFIKHLGEQLTEVCKASAGLKMINLSGGNNPLVDLFAQLAGTLFQAEPLLPEIKETLAALGIGQANEAPKYDYDSNRQQEK